MKVYQIWFETSIGPTFSTRKKAEDYLDEDTQDDWREISKIQGYPDIEEITLDDEEFWRDR